MNWRRAAWITVSMILLTLAPLILGGCDIGQGSGSGSPSSPASSAPPASSTAPTRPASSPIATIVSTASPTLTSYSATCQARQLRLSLEHGGVALGKVGEVFALTNSSSTACSLKGFATARLLDAAGRTLNIKSVSANQQYFWPVEPINTIELTPGASAYFATQAQDAPLSSGDVCVKAATTVFYLPNDATGLTAPIALTTCNGIVYVSPIVAAASDL